MNNNAMMIAKDHVGLYSGGVPKETPKGPWFMSARGPIYP